MKTSTASSWLQYWQHKPRARVRVFCFPYAGGGATIFRGWSECVPAEIEICPVQLPGRESRLLETPFAHLTSLIDELMLALQPYLDMPYAFFGHSMGAMICFELARLLRRDVSTPGPFHLFVSGHRAPQLPDPDPPTYYLPEPEFIKELRRLQGTPEEVLQNEELLRLLIPLLRADFAVCETYQYVPEEPLSCPITVFGGLQDTEAPRSSLEAWQQQTQAMFKLRFFKGDHFYMHKERVSLLQAITVDVFQYLHRR